MNALASSAPRTGSRVAPHPTHVLKLLIRRELWENKGGFIRAPLIAGAISLFFSLIGGTAGQMAFMRNTSGLVEINGQKMRLADVNWADLLSKASPTDLAQFHDAVNIGTMMSGAWPLLVFGIVVFFYLLGSLYDDRKDRSILFWKSLPVSDTMMVVSKLLTALVVAPLIAMGAALLMMLGTALIITGLIAINGANPFTLYWAQLDPLLLVGGLVSWLPSYIMWALPTAGWLMLCSAWARSKPFLWAIMIPVLSGLLVSWFDLLRIFNLGSEWFWKNIVARLLLGTGPGSHLLGNVDAQLNGNVHGHVDLHMLAGMLASPKIFLTPSLWIGVVAGIAMIAAAIRLRRWRAED